MINANKEWRECSVLFHAEQLWKSSLIIWQLSRLLKESEWATQLSAGKVCKAEETASANVWSRVVLGIFEGLWGCLRWEHSEQGERAGGEVREVVRAKLCRAKENLIGTSVFTLMRWESTRGFWAEEWYDLIQLVKTLWLLWGECLEAGRIRRSHCSDLDKRRYSGLEWGDRGGVNEKVSGLDVFWRIHRFADHQ